MSLAQLRQQLPNLRDYTDEELLGVVAQSQGIKSGTPQYDQLTSALLGYDRTKGEVAKDLGVGLVQGVLGLGQTAASIGGALIPGVKAFDNPVTNTLRDAGNSLDQFKSQGLRNQEVGAQVAGDIAVRDAAASGAGAAGRIWAGAKAQGGQYLTNPGLAVQDFTTSLPSLAAGGVIGRGAQIAARGLGAAESLAIRAGAAGGVGGASALQGGDVASDTFDRLRAAGVDYETAAREAGIAGVKGGAVSLGLAALPGATTIERSMLKGGAGVGRGGFVGAARGGLGEFVQESTEEGYGQYAGNQAVRQFDSSVDEFSGVGRAALQGGISAGPLGAFHGRHASESAAPRPQPRTETGEIDLAARADVNPEATYPSYDVRTPAANRRPGPVSETALMSAPGTDGQGEVPGFLRDPRTVPAGLRLPDESFTQLPGAVEDPRGPAANYTDLYRQEPVSPFDTSNFSRDPTTTLGAGPSVQPPARPMSPRAQAGATEFDTAPGAAPLQPAADFTRERNPRTAQDPALTRRGVVLNPGGPIDTSGLSLSDPSAQPAPAAVAAAKPQPNVGDLITALQKASTEMGVRAVRKDGEVANTAAAAPLREVIQSRQPLTKLRELYQDGKHPRDELLDLWHKELTGQTVSDFVASEKAATPAPQAAATPEPAAQVQALREGRVDTVVLGKEDAAKVNLEGLQMGVATGTDGATAVVVSTSARKVKQTVQRAKEVGLSQVLGEVNAAVAPTATSQAAAPAEGTAAVATPAEGTAAVATPAVEAAAPTAPAEKKRKSNSTRQVIQDVESARYIPERKLEYTKSLYKLWKRSFNGDDVAAYNWLDQQGYFELKSKLTPEMKADVEEMMVRFQIEQAQKLGSKFGAKAEDANPDVLQSALEDGDPALRRRDVVVAFSGFLANLNAAAGTTLGRAKPVSAAALRAKLPSAVEKILRGNGKTNPAGARAIREALQLISVSGPSELRNLAANTLALMPKQGIALTVDDQSLSNAHGAVELSPIAHLTLFTAEGRTGLTYATFLHEALHAAVAARYRTLSAAIPRGNDAKLGLPTPQAAAALEQFRKVWDEFNEAAFKDMMATADATLKLSLRTALADPDEFFVRALTDPALQAYMAQKEYQGKTLWTRFKDWVKRSLLGLGPETGTTASWLDAALIATTDLANAMPGDTPDFKRLHAINTLNSQRSAAKSETGSDVKMSAVNESALLRPFTNAAKAATANARAMTAGEKLSESGLNLMTLRQIEEQFGDKLPAFQSWSKAVFARASKAARMSAQADRTAEKWQRIRQPEQKALAEILLRASNANLELDNTKADYLAGLDARDRKEHADLREKLRQLSPEAQEVRKEALAILKQQWDTTHAALKQFITLTVPDPGLRKTRLDDLEKEFGRVVGDYFPLSRFGDEIVIARGAAKDGRDIVTFHESTHSADQEVAKMKAAGAKHIIRTTSTAKDVRKVAGSGFMSELHQLVDQNIDGPAADTLHEALQQLYLKSLPELSGAKHMMRRENIEGYSTDAMRAFADAVTRGSQYAAHLEFGPAVHAAMESAESQSRSSDKRTASVVIGRKEGEQPVVRMTRFGTDRLQAVEELMAKGYAVEFFDAHPSTVVEKLAGALEDADEKQLAKMGIEFNKLVGASESGVEDLRAAKQLYNYMVRRQQTALLNLRDTVVEKGVELAGQLGYAWYLGFSPAFWLMNTLQNPMIGIPHLGAKYGTTKASAELSKAAGWFAKVRLGKLFTGTDRRTPFSVDFLREKAKAGEIKLSKDELDMLQTLEDRQVLDFTRAADLSRIGTASNSLWYKGMRLAAAGAHHTEVFNRVSFALAAYRLALKSGDKVTHEDAVRAAEHDVAAVHFDYSYENKPQWMGRTIPAARLVFMFQQYRQHMLYWWASTVKEAAKGESPEVRSAARKAALLMAVTNGVFAGTLGLPFIGTVAFFANLLAGGDDGDEPFDFERWMREAYQGMGLTKEQTDVAMKGIFAAMGLDVSRRIGQSDLLPFLNEGSARFERATDDKLRAYLFDMLGPLGSMALGVGRSIDAFHNGQTAQGIAAVVPKAAADVVRALDLSSTGVKNSRGDLLATHEAFDGADFAMQAAGVTPISVSNTKAARGAVLDMQMQLQDQTRRLTGNFVQAWTRSDPQGMQEALADIQQFNARVVKRGLPATSGINAAQLKSAIMDHQRRALFLAASGGMADTRSQLAMAARMSGLYNLEGRDKVVEQIGERYGLPGLPALPGQ